MRFQSIKLFAIFFLLISSSTSLFAATPAATASWDAIAVDEESSDKNSYYGTGNGNAQDDANKEALDNCAKYGGKKCAVKLTYQQCGAYANAANSSGQATGATKKEAEDNALKQCKDSDCSVLVSDCVSKE